MAVETGHQSFRLGGYLWPEACHHRACVRMEEGVRQAHDTFAAKEGSAVAAASGQNDQTVVEAQLHDVRGLQQAAASRGRREPDAGAPGIAILDDRMRGEGHER